MLSGSPVKNKPDTPREWTLIGQEPLPSLELANLYIHAHTEPKVLDA